MLLTVYIRRNADWDQLGLAWIQLGWKCFITLGSGCPDPAIALNSLLGIWRFYFNSGFYVRWSFLNCYKEPPIFVVKSWNAYTQGMYQLPFPITSPLSLMVVWSGSHRAVVFMSEPGTCQPLSCTWCLWKVCTSRRTCPVDSPSALLKDENNNYFSIQLVLLDNTEKTIYLMH